jgi:hypothetical protein
MTMLFQDTDESLADVVLIVGTPINRSIKARQRIMHMTTPLTENKKAES